MKKILNILVITIGLLLAGAHASLWARTGDTCEDPIPLTPNYSQRIMQAGDYWYVANTFDLPMAITFRPATQTAEAPKLELDFSCTPGEYDDPILCDLFCRTKPAYIALPYEQRPPKSYDEQGKVYYSVEFGSFYRDMLLGQGIDYNVPVYIHATFYTGGMLEMEPDAFNNCMDNAKFMHLGDTVQVQARDTDRHVIVPYIQWQYDSIRYVWQGTQPCIFAVSNTCDFDPRTNASSIIDGGPNRPIQPGGQFKVSSALLMQYVYDQKNYPNDAGMYFAKFYSEAPGVMKIERIPAPAPSCGATQMRLGEQTTLERNDTNTVYAMPSSWIKSMQFTSPTSHILKMYVGKKCDFLLSEAIAVYQYDRIENGHQLDLFESDMTALWNQKLSNENYLYVRFECSDKTTVRPALWTPSDCMKKASRLEKGQTIDIAARSKDVYGIYYADWKGGDMNVSWKSTQAACTFYIADTCDVPNSSTAPVFYTGIAPKNNVPLVIPQATVDSWESHVDPDGYLYIRFYSSAKSKITLTTTAPEEEDNPCPTYDSISEVLAWDSCFWRGQMYYQNGRYTDYGTLDPETECYDSIFTLELKIRTTSYDTYTETACDSIVYHNKTYRESGTYLDTMGVTGGNRVIMTLNLTVNHSTAAMQVVRQYEPFTTATGRVINTTGIYLDTITNVAGCDSVITYDVTIYTTEYEQITETGCDSIVIDGKRYTVSGEYSDTLVAQDGNRTIKTLVLTINHSTRSELTRSACDSYTSSQGIAYTESGDYTEHTVNSAGCDSLITLHLTIGHTDFAEETREACVEYVSGSGKIYTVSGDYLDTVPNLEGCNTIVTLHLTVIPDCRTYDTVYFCAGLNTQHEEQIGDLVHRYLPYRYESPAVWDYMDGVILATEKERTLVDLVRAEQNLREHYSGDLTPVQTIRWTVHYEGEDGYQSLEAGNGPQWIRPGMIVLYVQFVCGEQYRSNFATDIVAPEAMTTAVKRMENGRVVIFRGGEKYTVLGIKID